MRVNARLLRCCLASVLAGLTAVWAIQPVIAQQKVGVNAAVNTDANGTPPGGQVRRLVIGQEVVHNERIITDAKGQTQILFIDGSSVSVGPNADLVIDEFIYDPATGTGKMTLTAVQGAMRFVGGKLSKQDNAVTLHIGTATIGVRGGVFVADVKPGGKAEIVFVYGKGVTVAGQSGCSESLYRPGFAVDLAGSGACPDNPHQAPPGATADILSQLDGRSGGNGGATTVPTDATVANSPVPNTISNNIQASIQQATNNAPRAASPPVPTVTPPQVPLNQIQIASSLSQPVVVHPPVPTPPPAPAPTPTPAPPAPPAPVIITLAGTIKIAPNGSTRGFTDQSSNGRIGFTGSLNLQNGTVVGTDASGTVFTLGPLTPGATTNVTATATSASSPATGTATLSADGSFFFANLTSTGSGAQKIFAFGGSPVAQSFFVPTAQTQFYAFNVQPDFSLGNAAHPQTIPFLPPFAGGTLSNAVVSPIYVAAPPNSAFGSFNALNNATGTAPFFLQSSLAINGQGSGQTAVFELATGAFSTSTAGAVIASGPVRSAYMPGGASLVHNDSGFTTVPDANGNNLFGGNSIAGFVLDQNQSDANGNFVQALANSFQIGVGSTTNYAFNQPVLATTLPSGVGTNRPTLNEQGYFGGIMTTGGGRQYVLIGANTVASLPSSNELLSVFAGSDIFTSASTGISSLGLIFGSAGGRNFARSAYIDNNIYGATESATIPAQITTPGGTTITYPTASGGAATFPTAAMVTSATVPGAANSLLPAGVSFCSCQFLQWGYWEANIPATGQGGPSNTTQSAYINTWVAGTPTVNLPTTGTGTYSGAAIGTVANAGSAYLAAGGFSNTYNFGNSTGTIAISNFDGQNLSGTVVGGSTYAGTISGGNKSGSVFGRFYGPGAAETGGGFAVQATSGSTYFASGIFAGKLTGPIH